MNTLDYKAAWLFLSPFAWQVLQVLAESLRERGYTCELFDDDGGDDEESSYRMWLSRDGQASGEVHFRLYDGAVQNEPGAAIGFSCFGPDAQLGHRYAPEAYNPSAYTTHLPTLQARILGLPLTAFADAVDADCKHWLKATVAA